MNLFEWGQMHIGKIQEVPGAAANPFIVWAHSVTTLKATSDEVSWCSSFVNLGAWLLGIPRSKSAAARSWLTVGRPIPLKEAQPGDVVIIKRGPAPQPGPEKLDAPGHVFIYGWTEERDGKKFVGGVGGNQSDGVTLAAFPAEDLLGIRRIT